jgi:hypothetical protein
MPHVQFWKTENGGRLDNSHRGGCCCPVSRVVDAADVRPVNTSGPN